MAPGDPTEVSGKVGHHMEGEFSYFLNFSKLVRFPTHLLLEVHSGLGNVTTKKTRLESTFAQIQITVL